MATKSKDKKKKKLGENEMEYITFKQNYMNFKQLGQVPDLPISKTLALNMRRMKPMLEEREEQMDEIIDKYAKIGEDGERLGIFYDVLDKDGKPELNDDGTKKQERYDLSGNYHYEWIDVGDDEETQKKYREEIEAFLKEPIEYKYLTIPSNKLVTVRVPREYDGNSGKKEVKHVEVEKELLDVLDNKISANMINILLDTVVNYVESE